MRPESPHRSLPAAPADRSATITSRASNHALRCTGTVLLAALVACLPFSPAAAGQLFTKITTGPVANNNQRSMGVSWVDYDLDDDLDIFLGNLSGQPNRIYRNDGGDTFVRINDVDPVTDGGASEATTWADYDNDGDLDLFVADFNGNNSLYRNEGNGAAAFTRIETGDIVTDGGKSRGIAWGDYDNDNDADLFVANGDTSPNFLYENNGDGTFTKVTSGPVVTDAFSSVGGSWGDYDNDGDLDLFVANAGGNQDNSLYRNDGAGVFVAITEGIVVNDGGHSVGSFDTAGLAGPHELSARISPRPPPPDPPRPRRP